MQNPMPAPTSDTEALPRLLGRYVLLRLLVRGGMGEVYLATSVGIEGAERPVVVKRIRREYRTDPSFHARFLDEARVQSQLDDPGVARIIEAAVDEHGDPFVVVEYVEGRSLADVRGRLSRLGKPLPWADAVAVSLEIASALAHVHERTGSDGAPLGIVHRDLSPQNVMVGFSGDVKLIDFGTARGDNRKCHTVAGNVLAKPGYVAPEVARGESATPRADIYALGVMLWELCAGRRYLEGDATEHVAQIVSGKLRPAPLANDATLGALGDGPVPAELDAIVAFLTEPLASQRCERAREAAQRLAGLLSSAPRRPVEERGVRARVKTMLARLYPTEPAASRVEFARLVTKARRELKEQLVATPKAPARVEAETPSERMTQVPDALPGTRYRMIRKLGEGAMGVVYEAEHVDLGRKVAVKVLQAKHSTSAEFVARFRREARAIASLVHPNLVQVYDFGQTAGDPLASEWGGRLFFAMERLEGETLEAFLDREQGMDFRDACEVAIKTCRALEAAHAAGLVHRDLKPANLFLCFGGRRPGAMGEIGVKLLDFGVAKDLHCAESKDDPNFSRAGAIFGTPDTMAPEQVAGDVVDERADLYALGCVLYRLLTGRMPFEDAPSSILAMSCHVNEPVIPPRTAAPLRGIPEAVERVVMRALEKKATARFADATEMREALEEAIYGGFFETSAAAPKVAPEVAMEEAITFETAAPPPARRRSSRRAVLVPMVFAAFVGCAWLAWKGVDGKLHPRKAVAVAVVKDEAAKAVEVVDPRAVQAAVKPEARPAVAAKAVIAPPPAPAPIASAKQTLPGGFPVAEAPPPAIAYDGPTTASIEKKLAAGDTDGALDDARALKADGKPASQALWARTAFAAGKFQEAHLASVAWLGKEPASIPARLLDARALRETGQLEPARLRLKEILEKQPNHAEAKTMLRDLEALSRAQKVHAAPHKRKVASAKIP